MFGKNNEFTLNGKAFNGIFYCDKQNKKISNLDNYQNKYFYIICQNGMFHNLNGPAAIAKNGLLEYYINGELIGTNLSNNELKNKIKEIVFK